MDRSDETPQPTAAPPLTAPARQQASAQPAADGAAVASREWGAPLAVAAADSFADDIAHADVPAFQAEPREIAPPLPLLPKLFLRPVEPQAPEQEPSAPPQPLPARVFLHSGPAFTPAARAVDALLSEIDAEASARSLTAVETPMVETPAPPNLGSHVPRTPTLSMPSLAPPPAFERLAIDHSARPGLVASSAEHQFEPSYDYRSLARRIGRIVARVAAIWLAIVLLLIVVYRFVNPPASELMLQHWIFGEGVAQTWVPIEKISPNIVRAVIMSEDGRFCEHDGVDFRALEKVLSETGRGTLRGASTISMQVVKNLFLWPSKSYLRKAIELPLTFFMELVWPKRRIMEVYLNIAEWGPGIFGIEAATQYHYHKSAKNLSPGEASRLAVALPNPITRNPARPSRGMQRLARVVQFRMRLAPSSQTACVLPRGRF
ncbi:MAG TPA: monofunctional biosynthetic peptidoglycan transglycosylase [Hyphomicrobium sp.]